MKSRALFIFRIFLSFLPLLHPLRAATQAEVQPLWDELSARWSANDSAGAEELAGKLIEALTPVATDFSLGIQMNSALHNRAFLRYNNGDYAGAEADLLAGVAQVRAILPPAGLLDQSIPAMMVMVDDRVRISLRGLVNFYLAAGDLERAAKAFEEAIAMVPLWKKQAQDNPAIS
jgi:tetratricopeptide (TPR) repeat protein